MLRKLIDNIRNNRALKNEHIRARFNLAEIKQESDLHQYKNLLNAMAALFFTNHCMGTVGGFFSHWRDLTEQR